MEAGRGGGVGILDAMRERAEASVGAAKDRARKGEQHQRGWHGRRGANPAPGTTAERRARLTVKGVDVCHDAGEETARTGMLSGGSWGGFYARSAPSLRRVGRSSSLLSSSRSTGGVILVGVASLEMNGGESRAEGVRGVWRRRDVHRRRRDGN